MIEKVSQRRFIKGIKLNLTCSSLNVKSGAATCMGSMVCKELSEELLLLDDPAHDLGKSVRCVNFWPMKFELVSFSASLLDTK